MSDLLRVYLDPSEVGLDGYPRAWHKDTAVPASPGGPCASVGCGGTIHLAIKDHIRLRDGHRCLRCHHPYPPGIAERYPRGEWTPCDKQCSHTTPYRTREIHRPDGEDWGLVEGGGAPAPGDIMFEFGPDQRLLQRWEIEAHWRILTVHHLNGIKHDCRWWNLVSLCQRCHLTIQGKVYMDRPWIYPHSEWFKPFAAGFYAWKYLGAEFTQEETLERLDELLVLELTQEPLF